MDAAAAAGEATKPRQRKPKTGVKAATLGKKRKAAEAADDEGSDQNEHDGDEMRADAKDDDDFESERKASLKPHPHANNQARCQTITSIMSRVNPRSMFRSRRPGVRTGRHCTGSMPASWVSVWGDRQCTWPCICVHV